MCYEEKNLEDGALARHGDRARERLSATPFGVGSIRASGGVWVGSWSRRPRKPVTMTIPITVLSGYGDAPYRYAPYRHYHQLATKPCLRASHL